MFLIETKFETFKDPDKTNRNWNWFFFADLRTPVKVPAARKRQGAEPVLANLIKNPLPLIWMIKVQPRVISPFWCLLTLIDRSAVGDVKLDYLFSFIFSLRKRFIMEMQL